MTKQAGNMTATRDAQGNSTKTKVCSFSGQHFIAERDGEELHIYAIGDESGLPGTNVLGSTMGDAHNPRTLADLNKINAARRGEPT